MEPRAEYYKKKRRNKTLKLAAKLSVVVLLSFCFLLIRMLPGTFAYFSAETQATGTIHNASSADLIAVNSGKISYGNNCEIKSTISIKNKSTINIPLTVELWVKKGEKHSRTTILEPNSTYSANANEFKNLANRCEIQEIKYRIIGFNGYIDDIYTIPIDQQKLMATKGKNNAKEVTPGNSQEIIQNAETQNSVVEQNNENKDGLLGN